MNYEETREVVKQRKGWSDRNLARASFIGQLFHNPLNFDNGDPIKKHFGWDVLFTDVLDGHRYYFDFHNYDLTNPDVVIKQFRKCANWKKYTAVWNEWAPMSLASEEMYAIVVTDMTVKGFLYEQKFLAELQAMGVAITLSTPKEDLAGIDAYADGKAIQIKSPATARRMR